MLQRHKLSSSLLLFFSSSLLLFHSFTLSYLCALCAPISVISVLPSLFLFPANLALCEPPKFHPDRSSGAFRRCAVEGSWHNHLILSAPFFPVISASSVHSALSFSFALCFSSSASLRTSANSVSVFTPTGSGRYRPSSLFLSTLVHAFTGLSQLSVSSAAPLFSLC